MILDFEGRAVDLPVDYDHQLDDKAIRTGPVPVAGWIKELKADARGLWGRVQWTATAVDLIGQKAYRYLSPSFLFHPPTGEVIRLSGAGLVHKPNFPLKALAREEDPMNADMPPARPATAQGSLMARLATAMGLPADTPEEEVAAMVEKLVAALERLTARPMPATAAELVHAVPDPARYVPASAVEEVFRVRNAERAEAAQGRAQEKVRAAIQGGYILPVMREWALGLCTSDEASFDTFLAKSGAPWAHLLKQTHIGGIPPSRDTGLDAPADRSLASAVCVQLGLKPGTLND